VPSVARTRSRSPNILIYFRYCSASHHRLASRSVRYFPLTPLVPHQPGGTCKNATVGRTHNHQNRKIDNCRASNGYMRAVELLLVVSHVNLSQYIGTCISAASVNRLLDSTDMRIRPYMSSTVQYYKVFTSRKDRQ
jgi:hypothetical protein